MRRCEGREGKNELSVEGGQGHLGLDKRLRHSPARLLEGWLVLSIGVHVSSSPSIMLPPCDVRDVRSCSLLSGVGGEASFRLAYTVHSFCSRGHCVFQQDWHFVSHERLTATCSHLITPSNTLNSPGTLSVPRVKCPCVCQN